MLLNFLRVTAETHGSKRTSQFFLLKKKLESLEESEVSPQRQLGLLSFEYPSPATESELIEFNSQFLERAMSDEGLLFLALTDPIRAAHRAGIKLSPATQRYLRHRKRVDSLSLLGEEKGGASGTIKI